MIDGHNAPSVSEWHEALAGDVADQLVVGLAFFQSGGDVEKQ